MYHHLVEEWQKDRKWIVRKELVPSSEFENLVYTKEEKGREGEKEMHIGRFNFIFNYMGSLKAVVARTVER